MDSRMPTMMDEADLSWSDHHTMNSEFHHSHNPHDSIPRSLGPWADTVSSSSINAALTSTASHHIHQNGQLSPVSTGMDIPVPARAPSSAQNHGFHDPPSSSASSVVAPLVSHSLSSSISSMDSWHTMDDFDGSAHSETAPDMPWERDDVEDVLMVPKPEPSDEDFCLQDVQEAPGTPPASIAPTTVEGKAKRARGRPRKHPLTPAVVASKVTKGRSKTGCITCRRRKKKCDETKPRCMNCEKNAVFCEGYPEKQLWRSGKERAAEVISKNQPLPVITLQPIFEGLETTEDMIFWRHYNNHLSTVLTVEGETKNAFTSMLIPIATRNRGLMHSILALSGKHIDYDTPHAANLLKSSNRGALCLRAEYHHNKAMELLNENLDRTKDLSHPERNVRLMACYSQVLCLFLESLAEGNTGGVHRIHLNAYRALIEDSPPSDAQFASFIIEFFQFHIFADELLRLPEVNSPSLSPNTQTPDIAQLAALENWEPPTPIDPPRLLGVADGLFTHLARITNIRNAVRRSIAAGADPVVPYPELYQAGNVDVAIRGWDSESSDYSRGCVALLWKQVLLVYLHLTTRPPQGASPGNSMTNSRECLAETSTAEVHHQHHDNTLDLGVLANTPPLSTSPSVPSSPPSPVKGDMGRHPGVGQGLGLVRSMSYPHARSQLETFPDNHPRSYSLCSQDSQDYTHQQAHLYPQTHQHQQIHQPQSQPQPRPQTLPHSQSFSHSYSSSRSSISSVSTSHTQQAQQQQQLAPPSRASSPPPIQLPPNYPDKISVPVSESLGILSSFSPSDPVQRLLLIPCLLVGTACYAPHQQEIVRQAVRTVRGYTGLRNADRVGEVLERVWGLMRERRWEECWDWQGLVGEMGWDFLCA